MERRFHSGDASLATKRGPSDEAQRSPWSFQRPIEADSCRSEFPASSTRLRRTTTPGAAGRCARMLNNTRFAARSSILGRMRSSARSTTTSIDIAVRDDRPEQIEHSSLSTGLRA